MKQQQNLHLEKNMKNNQIILVNGIRIKNKEKVY